ncbi:MAG: hypothetical protein CMJ19_22005 [Phycisphaeraceae bacterium]|nr:hypothetical protein [Phycisphaeraceae bacterium]
MTHNDRPKVYWFKAKNHGYGWGLPCSWQGWLFTLIWLLVLLLSWLCLPLFDLEQVHALLLFFGITALMCMLLVIVCYLKGEPASWRWGEK